MLLPWYPVEKNRYKSGNRSIRTAFNSSDFPKSLSCLLNPGLGSAIALEHFIDLNISVHSISVTAMMYAMVKVVEREMPAKLDVKKC